MPSQHQSSETKTPAKTSKGSVIRRFNLVLLLIYLLALLVIAPLVYLVTERQVFRQAETDLNMLVDMVASIQSYVAKDLRPYFIEKGLFHSPGFSGIVATSLIAENFKARQPDFYIKNSSDNPLNPANRPEPVERTLMQRFRSDRTLKHVTETGTIQGQPMLLSASAKISKPGCLRCHGDPTDAPRQIVEKYGMKSGYDYKNNEVVGVSVVGVPVGNVQAVALQRSLLMVGLLTGLFALIFISINLLVRRYLLAPIVEIAQTAHAVRAGDLDRSIEMDRDDEVGDLARSIELLRRSFVQAMKRLQKR